MNNVLIIGGKGKTGRHVAAKLAARGIKHQITSRQAAADNEIAFDWLAPQHCASAFKEVQEVFIIAPTNSSDHGAVVPPVLEQAISAGVKRFVLLSASSLDAGSVMMGQVHEWLMKNTADWAVLRPTWFMQNFSEQQHLPTIRQDNAIYSATDSGRVGFIDTQDIAEVAVAALTSSKAWNRDYILTGPESMSYTDVAAILSNKLGRNINHINLPVTQLTDRFQENGMDENYAQILASLDEAVAGGSEDRVTENVETLTGCKPLHFADFVQRELVCWRP